MPLGDIYKSLELGLGVLDREPQKKFGQFSGTGALTMNSIGAALDRRDSVLRFVQQLRNPSGKDQVALSGSAWWTPPAPAKYTYASMGDLLTEDGRDERYRDLYVSQQRCRICGRR